MWFSKKTIALSFGHHSNYVDMGTKDKCLCLSSLSCLFSLRNPVTGALLVSAISALAAPFSTDSLHLHLSCSCFLWWPKEMGPILPHSLSHQVQGGLGAQQGHL